MGRPLLADLISDGVAKVTGLPAPTGSSDAATKAYVDGAVEGLAWKDSARVATQANLNLASPGAAIDGVNMAANDRVLVMNQTTASQNGIYVWNGSAVAMTRAFDAQTANDLEEATLTVEEGSSAGASYRQTAINFVLNTDPVAFTAFGASIGNASTGAAGKIQLATQTEVNTGTDAGKAVTPATLAGSVWAKLKYAADIGDGSATSYDVTHNLGTRDVHVLVRENSGTYRFVEVETRAKDANTVTVVFASAPSANAYRVIVIA